MAERFEPASQPHFQPFLAWYGGIISFILGMTSEITHVDFAVVILQGFQIWKWDSMTDQCAIASWAVMATFFLIIGSLSFTMGTSPFARYVGSLSVTMGTSPFARYNAPIITKTDWMAPPLEDPGIIRSPWEAFLNTL